jgi:integral membrane sensor domain MASE1
VDQVPGLQWDWQSAVHRAAPAASGWHQTEGSVIAMSPGRIRLTPAAVKGLGLAEGASKAPARCRKASTKAANALVSACLQLLAVRGVMAWRNSTTGVYDPVRKVFRKFTGRKGVSDILGAIIPSGRLLAVECKSGKGRLTKEQKEFLYEINLAGGLAVVARSVDDLDAALREAGL